MNLLQNFHLDVIDYLYRGRRAAPLQTLATRLSNRKLPIVMALFFLRNAIWRLTIFSRMAMAYTGFSRGYARRD